MKLRHLSFLLLQAMVACRAILQEELGKDLPSNYNNHDILARKRRPLGGGSGGSGCNFNGFGRPKGQGTGRTFFDLQFFSVQYQDNYNINCGGGHPGSGGGGHVGQGGGGYKPEGGSGNGGGLFANKPSKPLLSMIVSNRPLQGLFGQTQTQTGIIGDTVSSIVGLLPKPQDIGQGLGEGISSFVQTVPQIGQSFLSLLPSFENFQLPSLPSLPSLGQGSQSQSSAISGVLPSSTPSIVTPAAPDLVTEPTVDPDDIIYNDNVKPVHEDPDVVTGGNKLPPGAYFNRYQSQNRYQSVKKYQDQKLSTQANQNKFHYQQNRPVYGQREPRLRPDLDIFSEYEGPYRHRDAEQSGPRGFRFPT